MGCIVSRVGAVKGVRLALWACLWRAGDTCQGGLLMGYVYLLVECVDGLVG